MRRRSRTVVPRGGARLAWLVACLLLFALFRACGVEGRMSRSAQSERPEREGQRVERDADARDADVPRTSVRDAGEQGADEPRTPARDAGAPDARGDLRDNAGNGGTTSFAFWNVENLFDTIRSPFYDDSEFTPDGDKRWGTERYEAKIAILARTIDELRADVVGLAEVENEAVVRDLVSALETDYNYIHRTSGDRRGIDQALLYKGDRFFPDTDDNAVKLLPSGMGREFLHVEGELRGGRRVRLVVCHMSSKLNSETARRRNMRALRTALECTLRDDPAASVITMGDMNSTPDEGIVRDILGAVDDPAGFMYAPHTRMATETNGGSYNYRGRWYLYDWMMVSPSIAAGRGLRVADAGVYARRHMTEETRSRAGTKGFRPRRTFNGDDYRGGASDHLPVWMTLTTE